MNNPIYRFLSNLILIAAIALTTSCTEVKTYKIGVSQCGQGQWREKVNDEMLAAQHLYEKNVKVIIANAHDDTQLQINQIDSLVNEGIDLLVVAPNESSQLTATISEVRKKGLPVIFFDRKAVTDDYTAFIGGSNVEAGRASGEYSLEVVESMPINGKQPFIMEITGHMSTSPAQERHEGFAKVMAEHSEINYVCREGDWTSEEACRITEEQIKTGILPDLVFCHNDGMATGVYKAIVEKKVEGKIKILGIDGLPGEGIEYVQFGHQVGSYIYPTHGEKIVRLALDILTGKYYERENILQGMMITPENVNLVDLNSRELMKQNHDLIIIQDKLEASLKLYNTEHKFLVASIVGMILLAIAAILAMYAFWQSRKTLRERQSMNEEQTLFYTDAIHHPRRAIAATTFTGYDLCRTVERNHSQEHVEPQPEDGGFGRRDGIESRSVVSKGESHHRAHTRRIVATNETPKGLFPAHFHHKDHLRNCIRGRFWHPWLLLKLLQKTIRKVSDRFKNIANFTNVARKIFDF